MATSSFSVRRGRCHTCDTGAGGVTRAGFVRSSRCRLSVQLSRALKKHRHFLVRQRGKTVIRVGGLTGRDGLRSISRFHAPVVEWQTRKIQVLMPNSVGVQVPPGAFPRKILLIWQ